MSKDVKGQPIGVTDMFVIISEVFFFLVFFFLQFCVIRSDELHIFDDIFLIKTVTI